jgi:spermidine synthase
MMSDTDMEHRTNWTACNKARGKVMIAGLGLGMILTAILKKPEVESVLVVEKYQDVIDLVSPHFNSPKLSIICADILDWKPAKGMKFDAIYFDVWPDICTDNLKQINLLHHRFKYFLNRENPSCWMGSWCQELLRAKKRQERNHSWY